MQLYALLEAGLVSYIVSYIGGNLLDDNLFDNVDLMVNQSVSSSVIASKLAALYLRTGGLLVLTGAGTFHPDLTLNTIYILLSILTL
jgi:hypothetical protein